MHTTEGEVVTFHHNGDYSGDVWIELDPTTEEDRYEVDAINGTVTLKVPFTDIKHFIAMYVMHEKISHLENADTQDDEILGVTRGRAE